jgi:hypothetical protein
MSLIATIMPGLSFTFWAVLLLSPAFAGVLIKSELYHENMLFSIEI